MAKKQRSVLAPEEVIADLLKDGEWHKAAEFVETFGNRTMHGYHVPKLIEQGVVEKQGAGSGTQYRLKPKRSSNGKGSSSSNGRARRQGGHTFREAPFTVLTDEEGNLWLAERMSH